MKRYLKLAENVALLKNDKRAFKLGAVGIRKDGAIVAAYNGSAENKRPKAHAEHRLSRKLDTGAHTVYVVRIRVDGTYGMAKPCPHCQIALKRKKVKKVIYSTNVQNEFGILYL